MRVIRFIVALVGFLLLTPGLAAPQLTLGDVKIVEDGSLAVVQVEFNFLVRYVRHFPEKFGDDLRINLEPIGVVGDGRNWLFRRQAIAAPPDNSASLMEVIYEGDVDNGPYLTLFFQRPVGYQVQQGNDFRSIVIVVQPGQGIFEVVGKVKEILLDSSEIVLSHEPANGIPGISSLDLKYEAESPDLLKGLRPWDVVKFRINGTKQKIVAIEPFKEK